MRWSGTSSVQCRGFNFFKQDFRAERKKTQKPFGLCVFFVFLGSEIFSFVFFGFGERTLFFCFCFWVSELYYGFRTFLPGRLNDLLAAPRAVARVGRGLGRARGELDDVAEGHSGLPEAVRLPLLVPAALARVTVPADVRRLELARLGVGLLVRPALGRDVERRRASGLRALAALEPLARERHLLALVGLERCASALVASLGGAEAGRLLQGLLLGAAAALFGLLRLQLGEFLGREERHLLLFPEERDVAPAEALHLALDESEHGGGVERVRAPNSTADLCLVGKREIGLFLEDEPVLVLVVADPVRLLHGRDGRAADARKDIIVLDPVRLLKDDGHLGLVRA